MTKKKLLIFGAGRMGLSHAAMAGLLDPEMQICIVEPNFKTRYILKFLLSGKVIFKKKPPNNINNNFTHAIIATPPMIHKYNLDFLLKEKFSGRILIEKPISIPRKKLDFKTNIMSGYVLNHSYFCNLIKKEVSKDKINRISIDLETNQDFQSKDNGWRTKNSHFPGYSLLSEFGSHCINLLLKFSTINKIDLIKNEDNYIHLADKDKNYSIKLRAKSTAVRKSTYKLLFKGNENIYSTDFYSYYKKNIRSGQSTNNTLAGLGIKTSSYLRGQDFANQMERFLSDEEIDALEFKAALKTDEILDKLINNY